MLSVGQLTALLEASQITLAGAVSGHTRNGCYESGTFVSPLSKRLWLKGTRSEGSRGDTRSDTIALKPANELRMGLGEEPALLSDRKILRALLKEHIERGASLDSLITRPPLNQGEEWLSESNQRTHRRYDLGDSRVDSRVDRNERRGD